MVKFIVIAFRFFYLFVFIVRPGYLCIYIVFIFMLVCYNLSLSPSLFFVIVSVCYVCRSGFKHLHVVNSKLLKGDKLYSWQKNLSGNFRCFSSLKVMEYFVQFAEEFKDEVGVHRAPHPTLLFKALLQVLNHREV